MRIKEFISMYPIEQHLKRQADKARDAIERYKAAEIDRLMRLGAL